MALLLEWLNCYCWRGLSLQRVFRSLGTLQRLETVVTTEGTARDKG